MTLVVIQGMLLSYITVETKAIFVFPKLSGFFFNLALIIKNVLALSIDSDVYHDWEYVDTYDCVTQVYFLKMKFSSMIYGII